MAKIAAPTAAPKISVAAAGIHLRRPRGLVVPREVTPVVSPVVSAAQTDTPTRWCGPVERAVTAIRAELGLPAPDTD